MAGRRGLSRLRGLQRDQLPVRGAGRRARRGGARDRAAARRPPCAGAEPGRPRPGQRAVLRADGTAADDAGPLAVRQHRPVRHRQPDGPAVHHAAGCANASVSRVTAGEDGACVRENRGQRRPRTVISRARGQWRMSLFIRTYARCLRQPHGASGSHPAARNGWSVLRADDLIQPRYRLLPGHRDRVRLREPPCDADLV